MYKDKKEAKNNIKCTEKVKFMDIKDYVSKKEVIKFKTPIKIVSTATCGGCKENEGPLREYIDLFTDDEKLMSDTWEKAESQMVTSTFKRALEKAGISDKSVDILFGGDLMNQCTGTSFGLCEFDIPYMGLYGACSTFAQGLFLASCLIDSGAVNTAAVCVSSHYCTAQRQYRFPLDYGAFPQPTAQNTVTGCGAVILSKEAENEGGVFVTSALPGIVIDRGIKDAGNMGAAMATAAADTTLRYFKSANKKASDFDLIATGDLGDAGHNIEMTFLSEKGITNERDVFKDCGSMIYDTKNQSVGCGGSGCGCSAVVTSGYIYQKMKAQEIKNALIIGTGAMMSPQTTLQGLSIPSVAHLVELSSK